MGAVRKGDGQTKEERSSPKQTGGSGLVEPSVRVVFEVDSEPHASHPALGTALFVPKRAGNVLLVRPTSLVCLFVCTSWRRVYICEGGASHSTKCAKDEDRRGGEGDAGKRRRAMLSPAHLPTPPP